MKFAKKNETVKVPTKRDCDAGYDVYANFDEDYIVLCPHSTTMIPTGLYSIIENGYYAQMFNRGSNGSKGLIQSCGVIDPSYRGEWFVAITNTNDEYWVIAKSDAYVPDGLNVYPYEKAICQFVILPIPNVTIEETNIEDILSNNTERGSGNIGSSEK